MDLKSIIQVIDSVNTLSSFKVSFQWPWSRRNVEELEQRKTAVLSGLRAANIDPVLFDVLIANEINRDLKVTFGYIFLAFTFIFTAASYGIVIADGYYKMGISPAAITGLVIETPLQFIGILYIIARNLFPAEKDSVAKIASTIKPLKATKGRAVNSGLTVDPQLNAAEPAPSKTDGELVENPA